MEGAATTISDWSRILAKEVTRLTALIEANEGAGIEEALLAAEAERDRLFKAVCFVILFDSELRSSTLFATTTLLAFCHGPLPTRSRASRYGHDVE